MSYLIYPYFGHRLDINLWCALGLRSTVHPEPMLRRAATTCPAAEQCFVNGPDLAVNSRLSLLIPPMMLRLLPQAVLFLALCLAWVFLPNAKDTSHFLVQNSPPPLSRYINSFVSFCFSTISHSVEQASLKFSVLLPQPTKCSSYRHTMLGFSFLSSLSKLRLASDLLGGQEWPWASDSPPW